MSVNSLILNAIHGTCESGCGCALCIPNTINKLESPQVTIDDKVGIIESTKDGLDQIAVADELLRNAAALEALWFSLETSTNIDAGIINIAVNALQSPYTARTTLPSLESFSTDYDTALEVSIESVGDMITKVWEAIRNFIGNIFRKVLDFFKRLFNMNDKLKAKADRNDRDIKEAEATASSNEDIARKQAMTIKLPTSQVRYISIVTNKHSEIAVELAGQVDRYRHFYNDCFGEYVKIQGAACEQALANNKQFIKEAEAEIARKVNKDDPVVAALAAKTRKLTDQQQAGYNAVLNILGQKNAGNYLGGLSVSTSSNHGDAGDLFDFADVEVRSHDIPVMNMASIKELNAKGRSLLIDHQHLIEGELAKVEALTTAILTSVETMVKTLKADYSEYPALIRTFNNNLAALQSHYNKLLGRLYRVVKHTSELCATVINDVVPAMITANFKS